MQKALWQMHIPLSPALSDVTGTTGLRMIRAIVVGERAPHTLAALHNSRGKKAAEEMALARTGPWRAAHLCVLTHALALCDVSTVQISACDAQIAGAFSVITPHCEPAAEAPVPTCATTPPRRQPHAHRKHAPAVNTRTPLLRMTGVDLVAGHGLSDSMAQTMLSEIGTAMRTWPDEQHCGSWLGLAPKHAIAGGKGLKSRTMKHRHRAAHAFRMAAPSVLRAHGAFGAFSRRLTGRLGPAQALVATAHKIARTVYHLLQPRVPYDDIGAAEYHQRFREREMPSLQQKAAKLGYTLSPA